MGRNVIDLFCGAGGISQGFKQAGFNILLGVDNDEKACKTYDYNFESAKTLCRDMKEIIVGEIINELNGQEVHVIVGGPPCQGFSHARLGRRKPDDPRNSLFEEFIRIVEKLEPDFVMMENVLGILTMKTDKGEKVIDVIKSKFSDIDYNVKYRKLNSANYGVPQKRRRVIFIASPDRKNIEFPEPTHARDTQEKLNGKKLQRWKPVENVLFDKKKVEDVYFLSQKMIDGFRRRKKRNEKKGYGFGWQHLDFDKPSYTIPARYYKDGADALVKYSENDIRMLTERECARVQSFPDNFEFKGGKKATYRQIGNAVPPLLAQKVAEKFKEKIDC